jgi:DNA-binding phage protein
MPYDNESPLKILAEQFNDIDSASMEEICIRATLVGIPIDRKANFKKFGERYLIQCLYFLNQLRDADTLHTMIKLIMKYKTLQSIITSEFKRHCIELYISNIMREHDIASVLSEYIFNFCKDIPEYEQFRTLAKSTGIVSRGIYYFEL